MIQDTINELIKEKKGQQKTMKRVVAAAVGTTLTVALGIFVLKYDINRVYQGLSERINNIELNVDQLEHRAQITPETNNAMYMRVERLSTEVDRLNEAVFEMRMPRDSLLAQIELGKPCYKVRESKVEVYIC